MDQQRYKNCIFMTDFRAKKERKKSAFEALG
jgi:hypothetical protein